MIFHVLSYLMQAYLIKVSKQHSCIDCTFDKSILYNKLHILRWYIKFVRQNAGAKVAEINWDKKNFILTCLYVFDIYFGLSLLFLGAKWLWKMPNFHNSDILWLYDYVSKKSLWWSFQNQKSQMYIFFNFPCWSSRDIFVWHFQPFLVENWPRKWAIFIFFIILWNLKIYQYVFHKSVWRNF